MSSGPATADTVASLLLAAAVEAPEVAAMVTPEERITYGELLERARQVARALSQANVEPGDRMAIWLANGVDWLVAHWGATLAGCIVVPLSTRQPVSEVVRLLRHSRSKALFAADRFGEVDAGPELRELLAAVRGELSLTVVRSADGLDGETEAIAWEAALDGETERNQRLPGESIDPDSVHLVQFTSGTTGEPKGAMLSHRGLVRSGRAHAAAWKLAAGEPLLVPNPFSHILGLMYGCLVPAAVGATSLTLPVFDVEDALELLAGERAVALTGAPTHLQMLAEHPRLTAFDLSALRLAMTGGAALSESWARRVVDGLGIGALVNGYGMSEAGSVAQTSPGEPPETAVASVGLPMDGLEVQVVDPDTLRVLPPGETGELWIRGVSVMKGYLGAPELTAAALTADDWLRTGDLVTLAEDGRIRYVNRLVEMFTVGGFNVYPARVEAVLREHPGIVQAAVMPLDDERLGARSMAFIEVSGSGDGEPADITSFCRERLAGYEVPGQFGVIDVWPLGPTGKIDRRRLADAVPRAAEETGGATREASGCALPEPEFGSYFVAAYPPFSVWDEKALPEYRRVLETAPDDASRPPGLYCHIPFCVERCRYCYYLSHSGRQLERIDAYLEGLIAELEMVAAKPALAGRTLDFVYFGGGTPSLLSTARLDRLLGEMERVWSWANAREVTFECAPASVTGEKLARLRVAGVTRLSLGVQQLDDEVLRRSGRIHQVSDVERAWELIQRVDFPIVNLDLMVGLISETEESFWRSLERVAAMRPESVTLYQMEIPLSTPLFEELQAGEAGGMPASWEVKHDRLERAFAWLGDRGYQPISAYTAVLDPERHGFVYQRAQYQGADLAGIGVASFSYLQGVHHQNETSLGAYLRTLEEGRLPLGRAYVLDDEERLVRELVLQLKLGRVDVGRFRSRFGVDLLERFSEPLDRLSELGWLDCRSSEIELTPKGLTRADRILPEFYLAAHREVRYS